MPTEPHGRQAGQPSTAVIGIGIGFGFGIGIGIAIAIGLRKVRQSGQWLVRQPEPSAILLPGAAGKPYRALIPQTVARRTLCTGALSVLALLHACPAPAALLVGNTRSDNAVACDEVTAAFLGKVIGDGNGSPKNPDDLTVGPDGSRCVSCSASHSSGRILRYSANGALLDVFAESRSLRRPVAVPSVLTATSFPKPSIERLCRGLQVPAIALARAGPSTQRPADHHLQQQARNCLRRELDG